MATSPPDVVKGSCNCGAVTYTAELPVKFTAFCHCEDCRVATGQPFVANFGVALDKIKVEGESIGKWSKPGGKTHVFCKTCGTRIGAKSDAFHVVGRATVREGTIDMSSAPHIQVAELPDWYSLPDDGRPRFDRWPA